MPNKKISQLTPKGSALAGTDLVEVSVFNGVTYDTKSLTGANILSGTGLTVGTTAIASGTVGRVLFEGTGNVVQQDSTLFWDNTNKRLGVGATPSTSVRLDVRAQGALSTDIALRVRNSANSANFVEVKGDGTFRIGDSGGGLSSSVSLISDGRLFLSKSGGNFIELNPGTTANRLYGGSNGWAIGGTAKTTLYTTGITAFLFDGTLQIASSLNVSGGATNTIHIQNGVAPTTSVGDQFKFYSADIVAGNAAPHFRTENGAVVKLYQETTAVTSAAFVSNSGTTVHETSTFDGYTLQQIVKALRNTGLLQ